nr:putative ribonuclease H-like domain-containing protein [Tanacetum cinerariifolium]
MDQQYPTVAKSWIQENSSNGSSGYNNIFNMSIMPCGRTVTLTTEDIQKKKNDVKARTTLLLSLPDEHQLRFSKSDLDTMSLDDLYNHLKVYELEVQKKSKPNSQNMAFISSAKHISGNEDGNTACVSTANTNVPTASASVATISQDTACAYIASQSSGSQIKFEDINHIDEDDIEEMDIKWNMTLLSMREDKFYKKTEKKISIHGSDVAGFDKSKDWSYMENDEEDHALVADEVAPTEFALMANTSAESKKLESLKEEKEGVDGKLAGLLTASKDFDNLIKSQRSDENKDGLGYSVVPPPPAQLYLSPKKDLSWTGLLECADDTITDYSRPSPTVESTSGDDQNRNPSVSKTAHSYANRPFHRTSAGRSHYRAPWVPTVNRTFPPVNRKFSTGSRNFPTANRKFLTASRKFPAGSTKCFTADMGMKGKVVKPSALTDDFSRFTRTFFLKSKDETSGVLKKFIIEIENLKDLKVKIIRCDNGGEFRNKEMNDFCLQKGIKRDFSNARTPQQNGVTERVLVNKSHNKTPYELFNGRSPAIGYLKLFGCHVMILNTLDNLGKFEEKGDEGYFIGYSMSSKAFRVFNKRTRRVEENLHVEFLENKAIEKGADPNWLFDIDSLTKSLKYVPVDAGIISTNLAGTKDATSQEVKKDASSLRYIALPNWAHDALLEFSSSKTQDHCSTEVFEGSGNPNPTASTSNPPTDLMETLTVKNPIPTASSPVPTAYSTDSQEPSSNARLISKRVANQEETPSLDNILSLTNWFEDILKVTTNSDESNGVEADISNMETAITASPTPTLRIHKYHPKSQIIGPLDTLIQTRNKSKEVEEQSFIATIHQKTNLALLQFCLFSCFLSQTLVDCPNGVRPIGIKWVLKNKKDERGIVIRNKARLVAQGHIQEEGIDYDEVFSPVARIKAIRLFLAYALFMGFTVYQMDVKSAFLYGTINEEVYVMQPPGFQDPKFLAKVYKVEKAMWDYIRLLEPCMLCREFEALMHEKFQMSAMGELNFFLGLQVLQKEDGIFLSQDKYVGDILKKFGYSDVRSSNTPMYKENP